MKSQASLKGHPIHPMLIVYPFAFLTGAFGFNVAASASGSREMRLVPGYLIPAGIGAGLLAAIPGVIDYIRSRTRTESSFDGRKRCVAANPHKPLIPWRICGGPVRARRDVSAVH